MSNLFNENAVAKVVGSSSPVVSAVIAPTVFSLPNIDRLSLSSDPRETANLNQVEASVSSMVASAAGSIAPSPAANPYSVEATVATIVELTNIETLFKDDLEFLKGLTDRKKSKEDPLNDENGRLTEIRTRIFRVEALTNSKINSTVDMNHVSIARVKDLASVMMKQVEELSYRKEQNPSDVRGAGDSKKGQESKEQSLVSSEIVSDQVESREVLIEQFRYRYPEFFDLPSIIFDHENTQWTNHGPIVVGEKVEKDGRKIELITNRFSVNFQMRNGEKVKVIHSETYPSDFKSRTNLRVPMHVQALYHKGVAVYDKTPSDVSWQLSRRVDIEDVDFNIDDYAKLRKTAAQKDCVVM